MAPTTRPTVNFAAGPSALPTAVLEQVQAELLNYGNTGVSVMELSHRSAEFEAILEYALRFGGARPGLRPRLTHRPVVVRGERTVQAGHFRAADAAGHSGQLQGPVHAGRRHAAVCGRAAEPAGRPRRCVRMLRRFAWWTRAHARADANPGANLGHRPSKLTQRRPTTSSRARGPRRRWRRRASTRPTSAWPRPARGPTATRRCRRWRSGS